MSCAAASNLPWQTSSQALSTVLDLAVLGSTGLVVVSHGSRTTGRAAKAHAQDEKTTVASQTRYVSLTLQGIFPDFSTNNDLLLNKQNKGFCKIAG
jgi:hypothetical protein